MRENGKGAWLIDRVAGAENNVFAYRRRVGADTCRAVYRIAVSKDANGGGIDSKERLQEAPA